MQGMIREGMRCTVMGLGRFGGGLGVTRWLLGSGCEVLVTDLSPEDQLRDQIDTLTTEAPTGRLTFRLGQHVTDDFTACDLVIANPAVLRPWTNPFLEAARAAGTPITTEIGLVTQRLNPSRVIGVTGSNGKSTTASMIAFALNHSGETAHLGGNFGGSLLSRLTDIAPNDWVVMELSSAMLWWLGPEAGHHWSPGIAVTTVISPNHLDWHGDEAHYRRCKAGITRDQPPPALVFSGREPDQDAQVPLRIPGRHNRMNALLAARVVDSLTGEKTRPSLEILRNFPGLPHRLQALDEAGRFYNDSKSTTPEATLLAIEAFQPHTQRVHLIAGGYDKGVPLNRLARKATHLAGLYTIGATGPTLADLAGPSAIRCGDLEGAVQAALPRMGADDILLLSPGCASWDQFPNYEARGEAFLALIRPLLQRGSSETS